MSLFYSADFGSAMSFGFIIHGVLTFCYAFLIWRCLPKDLSRVGQGGVWVAAPDTWLYLFHSLSSHCPFSPHRQSEHSWTGKELTAGESYASRTTLTIMHSSGSKWINRLLSLLSFFPPFFPYFKPPLPRPSFSSVTCLSLHLPPRSH